MDGSSSDRRFLFLVASARVGGNTETLARRTAEGLPPEVEQRWLRLADFPLPPFLDVRHSGTYGMPEGNARVLLEATLEATDLVFVAPLYWYGLPASAKLYLDHWSGWLRVPGLEFRAQMAGRTLWAISVSAGEAAEAEPLFRTLELTAAYMKMGYGGGILGYGSRPGDVMNDAGALAAADGFFAGGPR